MENLGYIIAVVAIIALGSFVISVYVRMRIHTRLLRDIHSGNFDDFDQRIESFLVRQTLSPYARELLRFQEFAAKGDRTCMVEQYNRLMGLKLSDSIKASLLIEGFNAFYKIGDKKHTKRILEAMTPELMGLHRQE